MITVATRPKLCPCPRTCAPIYNSMVCDSRIKDEEADMSQGYSGECVGKMSEQVYFKVGDSEHRNDVNHCYFTPLKGIIRFQENCEDLGSSMLLMQRALDLLRPLRCEYCWESSRISAHFGHYVDPRWLREHPEHTCEEYNQAPRRTLCDKCAVYLGVIKPHPENFGVLGLAKYM